MAYDRLNLKAFEDTWKAEHVEHIEDYLEKTLVPENESVLEEEVDILIDSEQYWNLGLIRTPKLNPDREGQLSAALGTVSSHTDFISGPIVELDFSKNYRIELNKSTIRQFYIINSKGESLFDVGVKSISYSDGSYVLEGGLSETDLNKFINHNEIINSCPHIISNWKSKDKILINESIIKELNSLWLSKKSDGAQYIPGESVYLYFTIRCTSDRPSDENLLNTWFFDQIATTKLYEITSTNIYELSSLAILNQNVNKHYKSKLLSNILSEISDFETKLGLTNESIKTHKTSTVYSEEMTEGFYPEAYHGYWISTNFAITSFDPLTYKSIVGSSGYKITKPLPVNMDVEGIAHTITGTCRHFAFLDENGAQLYRGESKSNFTLSESYFESIGVDPLKVKWFCVSLPEKRQAEFKYTVSITKKIHFFEMPGLTLTSEQGGGSGGNNTGASNLITLSNVDRIVAIGDSYTESSYTIKDKAWLSKVSQLSEYNYDNFALSGDTYRGQLNKIRTGKYSYAKESKMTWEQLHPTHAIMISKTNDTKYMNTQQFVHDMVATIETTKGLGAIPIICTEYHVTNHDHIQTAFDYYAKKYGGYYCDLTKYSYNLRGSDYDPFWGGSHPGTRSNHLFADPIGNYINKYLPRPYSSIKIFRARDTSKISDLDNYLFNTIEERAEKFKEISICHSALNDPSLYDNCTDQEYSKIESEYFKIMRNLPVTFNKVCLIDAILPTTVHDISEVQLITNDLEGVNCYVKDVLAEPYPSPAFCRRFDIEGVLTDSQVAIGNTYRSNKSTDGNYKVIEIIYDQVESASGFVDGTILICSGNKSTASYNNSVLTLTSGTGNSTLNCTYEAVGLSSDYPEGKQDVGHFVMLEEYGVVSNSILKRAMDYDKIQFLLVSDSEFDLKDVQIKFKGNITKTRTIPSPTNAETLYWDQYESLNAHPKFDDADIEYWLNSSLTPCSLTPFVPTDNCLPKGISKSIVLTPEYGKLLQSFGTINNTTTRDINRKVRVWARYFPDIFDSTTMTYPDQSQITNDSFDYAKLNVHLYDTSSNIGKDYSVGMQKLVGLHWTELELDLVIPPTNKTWYIGLEAVDKPIQLAYCDVI